MQSDFQVPSVLTCLYDFAFMSSHEIMAKGRVKKMWIYGWSGWGQNPQKNMSLKSILVHFK